MKIDRLLAILTILLQHEQVTAPMLAERLEVSRRTISRDIDAICQAGIPIVTRQGGNGGISIAEGFKLDKSVLSIDELQSILAGLRSLQSVSRTSGVERLMHKLVAGKSAVISLKDNIVIDLASHYKASLPEKIELLKSAIGQRRLVCFDYYSGKGVTQRTVEPYQMVFKWTAWYLFGFCGSSGDFRLFKLNRLWDLGLLEEIFQPRDIPAGKRDLGSHLTDHNRMVILFDKSVEHLLVEEYGPDSYNETDNGKLLFTFGYTNQEHILRWILGFGDKARVVEPIALRDEVWRQVQSMYQKQSRMRK